MTFHLKLVSEINSDDKFIGACLFSMKSAKKKKVKNSEKLCFENFVQWFFGKISNKIFSPKIFIIQKISLF